MGFASNLKERIKANIKARSDERKELAEIRNTEEAKQKREYEKFKVRHKYSEKRKSHKESVKTGSVTDFLYGGLGPEPVSPPSKKSRKKRKSSSSEESSGSSMVGVRDPNDYVFGSNTSGSDIFSTGEVDDFLHGRKRR